MTTNQNDVAFGHNSSATPGDVLSRLQRVLDTTPIYNHATTPLDRTLVRAAAAEISRLRAENARLLAQLNGDKPL